MKFGVLLAARMDSKRLPGKAVLPLMDMPMIELLIKRLKTSTLADIFVLVTPASPDNDPLEEIARRNDIQVSRLVFETGNALREYVEAGQKYDFDYCVRVTGDEPLVDGQTLDYVLEKAREIKHFDLLTTKPAFPHGIDYEVYPKSLLRKIHTEMNPSPIEREHVTYYIYQKEKEKQFNIARLGPPADLRYDKTIFLVDTQEDYQNMRKLTDGITDIYTTPQTFIKIDRQRHENLH